MEGCKENLLAQRVDPHLQQARVHLVDALKHDDAARAALQEAGQQLLHGSRRVRRAVRQLPRLRAACSQLQ
jgi:hypothetical protein